jgi:hypothetical protein
MAKKHNNTKIGKGGKIRPVSYEKRVLINATSIHRSTMDYLAKMELLQKMKQKLDGEQ